MKQQNLITNLNLKPNVVEILEANNIRTIRKLTSKTKADLRLLNLERTEIKKIAIELQLQGLNLKNNL